MTKALAASPSHFAGDCWFLASLAAFANVTPSALRYHAVDMGDGTYAVEFFRSGTRIYERVSNELPVNRGGDLVYAQPGSNNTMWVPIFEKALAYFRTGANSYTSLDGGWPAEAYSDLGVGYRCLTYETKDATSMYNTTSATLEQKKAVTLCTYDRTNTELMPHHVYTLISVSKDSLGSPWFTVRDPYGYKYGNLEDANGYATLTYDQVMANFGWCFTASDVLNP